MAQPVAAFSKRRVHYISGEEAIWKLFKKLLSAWIITLLSDSLNVVDMCEVCQKAHCIPIETSSALARLLL